VLPRACLCHCTAQHTTPRSCIKRLLQEDQNPRAEDIECLCKLLVTVGEQLEAPNVRGKAGMSQKDVSNVLKWSQSLDCGSMCAAWEQACHHTHTHAPITSTPHHTTPLDSWPRSSAARRQTLARWVGEYAAGVWWRQGVSAAWGTLHPTPPQDRRLSCDPTMSYCDSHSIQTRVTHTYIYHPPGDERLL
jgi:hypothetical protein